MEKLNNRILDAWRLSLQSRAERVGTQLESRNFSETENLLSSLESEA
ncbi:MAG: hypothetical protein ACTSWN_07555 [Promethearchaeota archaeon]